MTEIYAVNSYTGIIKNISEIDNKFIQENLIANGICQYETEDGQQTFFIFDDIEQAKNFASKLCSSNVKLWQSAQLANEKRFGAYVKKHNDLREIIVASLSALFIIGGFFLAKFIHQDSGYVIGMFAFSIASIMFISQSNKV